MFDSNPFKADFLQLVREAVQIHFLHVNIQFSQHTSFIEKNYLFSTASLSKLSSQQVHSCMSRFSILLHQLICLFLCYYHAVLITISLWYTLKADGRMFITLFFLIDIALVYRLYVCIQFGLWCACMYVCSVWCVYMCVLCSYKFQCYYLLVL